MWLGYRGGGGKISGIQIPSTMNPINQYGFKHHIMWGLFLPLSIYKFSFMNISLCRRQILKYFTSNIKDLAELSLMCSKRQLDRHASSQLKVYPACISYFMLVNPCGQLKWAEIINCILLDIMILFPQAERD